MRQGNEGATELCCTSTRHTRVDDMPDQSSISAAAIQPHAHSSDITQIAMSRQSLSKPCRNIGA